MPLSYQIKTFASAATWLSVVAFAMNTWAADAEKLTRSLPKPAIIYMHDGNYSDRAFIDAARAGVERAEQELGIKIKQYGIKSSQSPTDSLKKVADSGASPIIAVGYENVMAVINIAERYPNTKFTVVDGLVPPLYPNVQSVLFKDHEGAFLVGLIAAKISKRGHIGFVGGMDIPLIRNFQLGFTQGARFGNPAIAIEGDFVGDTPDAWSEPNKAYRLALKQFDAGADIIFAAAGGSGLGVLKAANETGKLAIGVDTNQNGLFPGHVLTSMVKRVDMVVYDALKLSREGKWNPGIKYLGVKEGALDYAVDENNRKLISGDLIEQVATAKERIISGHISIESYSPK
jgi:basic membrane protein A